MLHRIGPGIRKWAADTGGTAGTISVRKFTAETCGRQRSTYCKRSKILFACLSPSSPASTTITTTELDPHRSISRVRRKRLTREGDVCLAIRWS